MALAVVATAPPADPVAQRGDEGPSTSVTTSTRLEPSSQDDPAIALLNPDDYGVGLPKISDETVDPFRPSAYHFVASIAHPGAGDAVVFEVLAGTEVVAREEAFETSDDRYWWTSWQIPESFLDGEYVVAARLLMNGETVATDRQPVVVDAPSEAGAARTKAVRFRSSHGDPLWFYGPEGERPGARVHPSVSTGAAQVRVLYTTAAPGREPSWTRCGSAPTEEDPSAEAVCTLAEGTSPRDVTAIAAVANATPPTSAPDPAADGSGAVIVPRPSWRMPTLTMWPHWFDRDDECDFVRASFSAPAVDVDVHLVPRRRSARADLAHAHVFEGDAFAAPDRHHGRAHPSPVCAGGGTAQTQARHRRGLRHAESRPTDGNFVFGVFGPRPDGTRARAWIDHNGDDRMQRWEPHDDLVWGEDRPSIAPSARRVRRGRRVRFEGDDDGTICRDPGNAEVLLQATRPRAGRFRTVARTSLDGGDAYRVSVRVRRTKLYRVVRLPVHPPCRRMRSRGVVVRVRWQPL